MNREQWTVNARRGDRVAEGARLLSESAPKGVARVRIPASPPSRTKRFRVSSLGFRVNARPVTAKH